MLTLILLQLFVPFLQKKCLPIDFCNRRLIIHFQTVVQEMEIFIAGGGANRLLPSFCHVCLVALTGVSVGAEIV